MPSITRGGETLHFSDEGKGAVIILQHPLTADSRAFSANGLRQALVADGFRCLVPDAVGHGRSSDPKHSGRVHLAERVADTLAVADAAGVDRFAIIGYSMGAWIATGLIETAPERIISVVLGGWDLIQGAQRFTAKTDPAARRAEFRETISTLPSQHGSAPNIDESRLLGFLETYDHLFAKLPSLNILAPFAKRMLIMAGDSDPYFSAAGEAAAILGAQFRSCPGDHVNAFLSSAFRSEAVAWIRTTTGPLA